MQTNVLTIAFEVITPIVITVAVAVLYSWRFKPDPQTLVRVAMYVLNPPLVFMSIANSEIDLAEMGELVLAMVIFTLAMTLIGWGLARAQNLPPPTQGAFMITILLMNAGNFGLPFIQFAFGDAGLQRAVIIMVMSAMLAYTLGIYVASSGAASMKTGLTNILTNPLPYAAVLGFAANMTGFQLPLVLDRALSLMAEGAIPLLMVVLGVQLAGILFSKNRLLQLRAMGVATLARLALSPFVVLLVTFLLGIDGLSQSVLVIQLSMPAAINGVILCSEYGSDAEFATAAVLVTTLASVLSLSVLIILFV